MPARPLCVLRYNRRDDNVGDQLLLRALSESLAGSSEVVLVGQVPEWLAGVKPVDGRLALLWREFVQRCGGRRPIHFAPPGARFAGHAPAARRRRTGGLRLDRVVIGVSLAPGSDLSWGQDFRWIGVRDHRSLEACRASGLGNAHYFPDLAFMDKRATPADHVGDIPLAMSFREQVPESNDSAYRDHTLAAVRRLHEALAPGDPNATLFYHQVTEDAAYVAGLAETVGERCEPDQVSLASYASFYRRPRVVASNRLHCLLMAALAGCVPLAVSSSDHAKLIALFETLGWERMYCDHAAPGRLDEVLADVQANYDELRDIVLATCADQRTLAETLLRDRVLAE